MDLKDLQRELRALQDPERAKFLQGFFKSGPGEYAEGDRLMGIRVPDLRRLALRFRTLPLPDVLTLLQSPWHERRLVALLILVEQYRRGDDAQRQTIFDAYLANRAHINNWDLVDTSAHLIVGPHLDPANLLLLEDLARAESLWDRRIAMLATLHWIKQEQFAPALVIATLLVRDSHDLIHKAVGWMLREIGKRDLETEEAFLREHYRDMPRTMLRYAIEKFPEELRQKYLRGQI